MDFCLLIYIKTDVILYIWVHACVIWNTKTINITKKINSLNFMCTLTSGVSVMVFNVTFNNISVISWRYVLLVEENGVSVVNPQPVASYRQTLSHNVDRVYLT